MNFIRAQVITCDESKFLMTLIFCDKLGLLAHLLVIRKAS